MLDSTQWVGRPHPGPRTVPLPLSEEQRAAIERAIRPEDVAETVAHVVAMPPHALTFIVEVRAAQPPK